MLGSASQSAAMQAKLGTGTILVLKCKKSTAAGHHCLLLPSSCKIFKKRLRMSRYSVTEAQMYWS